MTPEQLALLRAAAEKATPGPWTVDSVKGCYYIETAREDLLAVMDKNCGTMNKRIANANFVAAANPATVLALLDQIAQQAVEINYWKGRGALEPLIARVRASTIEACVGACAEIGSREGSEWSAAFNCMDAIRALTLPTAPNEEKS